MGKVAKPGKASVGFPVGGTVGKHAGPIPKHGKIAGGGPKEVGKNIGTKKK